MANLTRETVMQALFALFAPLLNAPFLTIARTVAIAPDIPTGNQPALVQWEGDEKTVQGGIGQPPVRTWDVRLVIYAHVTKSTEPLGPGIIAAGGATVLNPLIDLVEALFLPTPGPTGAVPQRLGGLVARVWIDGDTIKETGDVDADGQALAMIPLKLLIP